MLRQSGRRSSPPKLRARDARAASQSSESCGDDGEGSVLDLSEVFGALERFGVDLVDVLRARRPSGKPRRLSRNFQATNGSVVSGRSGQDRGDGLAGQLGGRDRGGIELGQLGLLFA